VSDDHEQVVRALFERWNAGDRELPPEEIHPDAVVYSAMTGHTFHGTDGIRDWMAEIDDQFEDWQLRIDEIRAVSADRMLALGTVHFRGRASGVEFDQPMGWVYDFEGDRVIGLRNIVGHDAAIEAAGLTPSS
jgi:ketosteroid isomerase-like protein